MATIRLQILATRCIILCTNTREADARPCEVGECGLYSNTSTSFMLFVNKTYDLGTNTQVAEPSDRQSVCVLYLYECSYTLVCHILGARNLPASVTRGWPGRLAVV
jgi:hypothetical protein